MDVSTTHGGIIKRHLAAQDANPARRMEKGEGMSTAVLTLNTWSLEYHQTMAATERARLNVAKTQQYAIPKVIRAVAELVLWYPFSDVTRDTEKLVSLLERLESYPSSILLEEDALTIPQSLRELFRKMCAVIQQTQTVGLHEGFVLKKYITKLEALGEQINEFAFRYEDAQKKLLTRVSAEEAPHYQESFAAYGSCEPTSEQASDEDVKNTLLRF